MSAAPDPVLLGETGDDQPAMFEPADVRLALHGPESLRSWNDLGVLIAADLHVARSLGQGEADHHPDVLLAAALAVRALRLGHVCVDLSAVATTVTTDLEPAGGLADLPWPEPVGWVESVAASAVVAVGDDDPAEEPLRLVGPRLYLDRYWHQERQVAADLRARSLLDPPPVDAAALAAGLDALFGAAREERTAEGDGGIGDVRPGDAGSHTTGGPPDLQRLAAATAVASHLSLVAGGPGTGKTTTVARILALLELQADALGQLPPRVALAAPTGKAAARLQEAVHEEAGRLRLPGPLRERLLATEASTLHRLLGWRPGSHSRFRHDRRNRLPHTVVIVDETSMLSLSLMAKLVDAVRPQARLVLVGDPQQLASVEAGAVLGDIVGPVETGLRMTGAARTRLARLTGQAVPAVDPPAGSSVGDGIVVLRHVHRFGGGIAALADAVRAGDADTAVGLLGNHAHGNHPPGNHPPGNLTNGDNPPAADVRWIDVDITDPAPADLAPVASDVARAGGALTAAAQSGDGTAALAALASTRILCPHRRGPAGVEVWSARVEGWLRAVLGGEPVRHPWYVGRPLLVTDNDYELQLFNGDTGVVVRTAGGDPAAVFERRGQLVTVSPSRLGRVETLHAMTIHKSQGSQFDAVTVILPEIDSPILTRQLLYTAITRARHRVTLVGTEASFRAAVDRPIARASGLGDRLWA